MGGLRARAIMAVVNRAAGRAGPKAVHEMEQIFEEAGVQASVLAPEPKQLSACLEKVVAGKPDVLILLAGDGTARLAAELCGPKGPLLAPLPGGTMNMLPKALYGEADWRHALQAILADGVERAVGGGVIGGHTFYCAAMIGASARFAPAREAMRGHKLGEAVRKLLRRGGAVHHHPWHDHELDAVAGPLEIGDGDAAQRPAADCLDEAGIAERLDVAVALEALLVRVHRPGHVDGQDELEIDLRLGPHDTRRQRVQRERQDESDRGCPTTHRLSLPQHRTAWQKPYVASRVACPAGLMHSSCAVWDKPREE